MGMGSSGFSRLWTVCTIAVVLTAVMSGSARAEEVPGTVSNNSVGSATPGRALGKATVTPDAANGWSTSSVTFYIGDGVGQNFVADGNGVVVTPVLGQPTKYEHTWNTQTAGQRTIKVVAKFAKGNVTKEVVKENVITVK